MVGISLGISAWKCAVKCFSVTHPPFPELGSRPEQQLVTEHLPQCKMDKFIQRVEMVQQVILTFLTCRAFQCSGALEYGWNCALGKHYPWNSSVNL